MISTILALIPSDVWLALGGLIAGAVGIFTVFLRGKSQGRKEAADKANRDYTDTRKRIDEDLSRPRDASDARSRLHDRKSKRGL